MPIRIELFGIPRLRAGRALLCVEGSTVAAAMDAALAVAPGLHDCYMPGVGPRPGFVLNLNGQRFLSDLTTPLSQGDSLLLLSADAGG